MANSLWDYEVFFLLRKYIYFFVLIVPVSLSYIYSLVALTF